MSESWGEFSQRTHDAIIAFVHGDPTDYKALWSRGADISIMGAAGGHEEGWAAIQDRLDWAARFYGPDWTFSEDTIAQVVEGGLGLRISLEHIRRRSSDGSEVVRERRVTHVARLEAGRWRIIHQHSDPMLERKPLSEAVRSE